MILKKLDGNQLILLMDSGAKNLRVNYKEVDDLNVFPVPDGDTGTNMSRTIEGGVTAIQNMNEKSISVVGKEFSRGTLMSARGNSGVILSQIYRGIVKGLADKTEVNAAELGNAFKMGVKQAYGAVIAPVEGTILTVFREATDYACKHIDENSSINDFYELHLKQAIKTLKNTQNLLPVLKEAGVIDSGGAGYVYIVKGIVKYLDGEKIEASIEKAEEANVETSVIVDTKPKMEHKKYAIVAVAQGKGIVEQFKAFGVDYIINGNQTMNPSTEDFINAFKQLDAENIIVFPNNKNIIMAAEQARAFYKDANVVVVHCLSIPQCYSALTMLDFSSDDLVIILGNFNEAIRHVVSLEITTAIRTTRVHGISIRKGNYICITNGKISLATIYKNKVIAEALKKIPNINEKEVLTIIYGKDVSEEEKTKNLQVIKAKFPNLEVGSIDGGQSIYKYLIAVE